MKAKLFASKAKKIDWEAVCERTRQRCNRLSEQERRRFRAEALRIVNGSEKKKPAKTEPDQKINWTPGGRKPKPRLKPLTDAERQQLLREALAELLSAPGDKGEVIGEFGKTCYLKTMKQRTPKEKAKRRAWLLKECERLRHECSRRTDKERRQDLEHALQIIYGTDATAPAGRV